MAIEPNVQTHHSIMIFTLSEAIESADLFVLLVKHKSFENTGLKNKFFLNFCGLSDNWLN
jgi:hypothetical protein